MSRQQIMIYEYSAPSHWASYLINGDSSGLDEFDIKSADQWVRFLRMGDPVDCVEDGFRHWHDCQAQGFYPYAADCSVYTFIARA